MIDMSQLTQDGVVQLYLENAAYDANQSVEQCRRFIAACRALLAIHPADWQHNQQRIAFDQGQWERQIQQATAWMAANACNDVSPKVVHASFGGFY